MLSIASRIPKKKSGSLQPVLPLVPEKLPTKEDDKSIFLTFELKTQEGQPDGATKYKKSVRKFEEGSPQQWIDLIKDLQEIWKQNSIKEGSDRAATVRSLVKGESATAFETALEEASATNEGDEEGIISKDNVIVALNAVATTVFPHRALEMQKLWMNRRMYKPAELTTRQTSAAINRLNNSLPLFPGGSDDSKFTEVQIVELLEWSLPPTWRAKFDLDGYIPSLGSKSRLIEACEAIERNEFIAENNDNKKGKKGRSYLVYLSPQTFALSSIPPACTYAGSSTTSVFPTLCVEKQLQKQHLRLVERFLPTRAAQFRHHLVVHPPKLPQKP